MDIFLSVIAVVCNLIVFTLFGSLYLKMTKQAFSLWMSFLSGVFFYFGCFSLICIPCVLGRTSFQFMMTIWLIICAILCIIAIRINYKNIYIKVCFSFESKINIWQGMLLLCVFICLFILVYFVIRNPYLGWDTAYYSKVVENAVNDNYMFASPSEEYIEYRYALSSYYMHAAINAKIFGLHHLTTLKLVMGGLCVIYTIMIVVFALKLMVKQFYYICTGIIIWVAGVFAFNGMYNQSGFLLYRAYEAKAWCSNIIVPLLLIVGIQIWNRNGRYEYNKLFVLISATADVMSMSSLIVVPAAILCVFVPKIIVDRSRKDLKTMLLSLLLSIGYLMFFIFMTKYM